MEAIINIDGFNVTYSSNEIKVTIFLSNTGTAPAYDVLINAIPRPETTQLIYSFSNYSYIKLAANQKRQFVNPSSCGMPILQIDPDEIIEANIIYPYAPEPIIGSQYMAIIKYSTNSIIKYSKYIYIYQ